MRLRYLCWLKQTGRCGWSFGKLSKNRKCLPDAFGAPKPRSKVLLMSFLDKMQEESAGIVSRDYTGKTKVQRTYLEVLSYKQGVTDVFTGLTGRKQVSLIC